MQLAGHRIFEPIIDLMLLDFRKQRRILGQRFDVKTHKVDEMIRHMMEERTRL